MTKIKCAIESDGDICRYLKSGYCTRDEIEIEWEGSTMSMETFIVCSNADRITNMMPEWEDFKNNRSERYLRR